MSNVSDEAATRILARIFARMSVTSRAGHDVLVDFGKRHRQTDKRAALHRSRPPADQSVKRVESWMEKLPDTPDTHDLLPTCYAHPREDVTRMLRGKRSRGI